MKKRVSHKLKIAVLCGGDSPEREISLQSGKRIAAALRRCGYLAVTVDPTEEYAEKEMQFTQCPKRKCSCLRRQKRRETQNQRQRHGKSPNFTLSALRFCQRSDAVFMALHGGAGEDGRVAAVLECMGIQHTGSDHTGLCISMDKALSKRLMTEADIPTPEYVHLPSREANHGDLPRETPIPCVIKPTCGGSSIGVKIVESRSALESVLNDSRYLKSDLLIERMINGREFTVGILCDEALAVTEIIPRQGFYDYRNKYTKGATEEITPANIEKELEAQLKSVALATHKALCLGSYSRVDLMVEKDTNQVYVLEANAIPGMTETSLLPQGAKAVGIDFDKLCDQMLRHSILS